MAEIRALTVRQPWAFAIVHGDKRVENRSQQTHYCGLISIHAGARSRWDPAGQANQLVRDAWEKTCVDRDLMCDPGTSFEHRPLLAPETCIQAILPFGYVSAVADLTGCHHAAECEGCSPRRNPRNDRTTRLPSARWISMLRGFGRLVVSEAGRRVQG